MKTRLEEALALYEKLENKHTKANSLRLRNILATIKNEVTSEKRRLMSLDKK